METNTILKRKKKDRKVPKKTKTLCLSPEAEKVFEKQFSRLLERARDANVKLPKKGDFLSAIIVTCAQAKVDTYEL